MVLVERFTVDSPNVVYEAEHIKSTYRYETTEVKLDGGECVVKPVTKEYQFKTTRAVPKLGVMLVGLGGNNGSTLTAGLIANREGLKWRTPGGEQSANYFGSLLQSSTCRIGNVNGEEVHAPFNSLVPCVHPNDVVIGGWDISKTNLADAMVRAGVLPVELQDKVAPQMRSMVPLPAIYDSDFIAANQESRADNVLTGSKKQNMEQLRADMRAFKAQHSLDKVVVLWTANTERFSEVVVGMNDTYANLMAAIDRDEKEVSPSTLFAMACILEGVPFVNGSPQNTFVPGCMEAAIHHRSLIAGDDFKSGQTKMKSVLVDFLVGAGLKPRSIVSYNHLGNNDGHNLSTPATFRSKEISKSNVVDDMVASNELLYAPGEHPDHVVVIKYVPYVGDSKRAMDEYVSEIFMGGTNTIIMHNTCEDSLLAAPIILDLILVTELFGRIQVRRKGQANFERFHPVLSVLSFFIKAPLVPPGSPVVNALFAQRGCLVNIMRACIGLAPENHMLLEHKIPVQ